MRNGGINERFRKSYRINKKSGCWIWNKCFFHSGYGRITFNYVNYRAHRLSYLLFNGNIKKGLYVCHKCDNRKCVNPDHLFLGSALDNRRDCIEKGRAHWSGKKLSHKTVLAIRNSNKGLTELTKEFNVTQATILNIRKRKTYRYI